MQSVLSVRHNYLHMIGTRCFYSHFTFQKHVINNYINHLIISDDVFLTPIVVSSVVQFCVFVH